MATRKKTKKKPTKSKRAAAKKMMSAKALAKRGRTPKMVTKKKAAPKTSASKGNVAGKQMIGRKMTGVGKRQTREERQREDAAFTRKTPNTHSGEQSGDFQGLRNVEGADSESVDELLEEGNAFEAEVVMGVEDAADNGETEVRTHEVPEDDVPSEYLDKDE